MTTTWQLDAAATIAAREVLPCAEQPPAVRTNGAGVYLVEPTPWRRLELVWWNASRGFVVAAEQPPPNSFRAADLPLKLRAHFLRSGLRPWRLIPREDVCAAIRCLMDGQADDDPAENDVQVGWIREAPAAKDLVGESRLRLRGPIGVVVGVDGESRPPVYLAGVDGIGRRTLATAVAQEHGWRLRGELPLGRVLVRRVLQRPVESCLKVVLDLSAQLGPDDLVVVSDAECLGRMPARVGAMLIRELARLPHVVLTGLPVLARNLPVARFDVPGLETADEARQLIAAEQGDVRFAGAALPLLLQAATVTDVGIVPGRLLTLLQVAVGQANYEDGPPELCPDEVVAAHGLLRGGFESQLKTSG